MPGNLTPKQFRYPTLDMSPDIPRDLGYLAEDIDQYLTDNPGPAGPQGPAGPTGATGEQGPQGPQGTAGVVGPQGPEGAASTVAGPAGAQGPQGEQGVKGDTGEQGPQGDKGDKGDKGDTGDAGPQGETGTGIEILGSYTTLAELQAAHPTGNLGDGYLILGDLHIWDSVNENWQNVGTIQGPQGPQGAQGPQGTQGIKGDTGDAGADSTVSGPQGPQGIQGPIGPQGIQGPVGPQGDIGLTGDQGPQSTFSITSATPPSSPVEGQAWFNSLNGKSYIYYDSFWVEVGSSLSGPAGDTGEQGPQGPQGPQGVAINLKSSSLTVEALPSTGNTVNDARIVEEDGDLYIWGGSSWTSAGQIVGPTGPQGPQGPQGDTGDVGPQGPEGAASTVAGPAGAQGPQGEQGVKGDTGEQGPQGPQGETGATGPAGAGGGAWVYIGAVNSTGGSTVSFSNLNGTYKELFLTFSGVYSSGTAVSPIFKLNNSTNFSDYDFQISRNYGGQVYNGLSVTTTLAIPTFLTYSNGHTYGSGFLRVTNANSTGNKGVVLSHTGILANNVTSTIVYDQFEVVGGSYNASSVINSINISTGNGTWGAGSWKLWGLT